LDVHFVRLKLSDPLLAALLTDTLGQLTQLPQVALLFVFGIQSPPD
jgi:hypothetical protein